MYKKNYVAIVLVFCWGILFFFFFSIMTRFLTRQILVERLHWDNVFTHIVFAGNQRMNVTDNEDEISVYIDWKEEYPFSTLARTEQGGILSGLTRIKNFVFHIENKIKTYTTDMLIGQYGMTVAAKTYNNMIGSPLMQTSSPNQVIYLQNGYLTYEEKLVSSDKINEIADSVQDFSMYLNNCNIGFVYVNAGSKVCPYDKQLPLGANEHSNENGDNLIHALKARNIKTLDFRDYMVRDGLDWYQSYYISDHHWKTTTGLWAAGIMAEYLNENFGFDFDKKYFDITSYNIELYPDYFLGGQGRAVTMANCNLESYEKILPMFDTVFSLQIPTRGIDLQGAYQDVLFNQKKFDAIAEYSEQDFVRKADAYGSIRLENDAYGKIRNLDSPNNEGKKILLIYDSFSWYLASYLATDVSEIVTVQLSNFNGSIRTLVDKMKPDVVIMIYCERHIRPIENWDTHKELFDLR